ncbi:helix-turn-helix transcriptional regulator [Lactobacillus terrae]|uniref:helix-turn-helix transcriptional regulator n=1 Tax=Lactobacillus terrae TaxID=2269374 RepID=UPI001472E9FF|nr:helix-turn-helix transcriptional regulator [Lactobacillus terrae]
MNISKDIKKYRLENKISNAKFAQIISEISGDKVAKSTVSRWENEQTYPNGKHMLAIQKLLNLEVKDILE